MLIDDIKEDEGYRGFQYDDHLGNPTIGYGTLLPITEEEAELLLKHRLKKFVKGIMQGKPEVERLPLAARLIILNMAYQMGVGGVLKFKNMWKALENGDYKTASAEMLDSTWATQTPNRANRLAYMMENLA